MSDKRRLLIAGTVLAAGAAFLVIGISRGELDTVFRKAINICLECIGIG